MAYTDRYYATSEDDPFPTDPFRKYFGKPSPTPTPSPRPTQLAMNDDSRRPDGTLKGPGYLGSIPTSSGKTMTEKSIGVNINGRETLIPSIVPTLSKQQVDYLANNGDPRKDREIVGKATAFAKDRLSQGLSPFAQLSPTNAADRVTYSGQTATASKKSSIQDILPGGPIGLTGATGVIEKPMTHTELATSLIEKNLAAQSSVYGKPEEVPVPTAAEASSRNFTPYDLQVQRFGSTANRAALQDPAFRPGGIAAATAGGQPLQTATQPGRAALDIVPTGVPLMSVKGIVNPATGKTEYQPLNQPSPYQGPAQYQVQQAATDFYRKREEDRVGYGSAY